MNPDMITLIRSRLSRLSRSERKVAESILTDPRQAIRTSIATMAKQADVSEPTVNRFCRSLDCTGFPDFKLKLAQTLATSNALVSKDINATDDLASLSDKIFSNTIRSFGDLQQSLDLHQIERASNMLTVASRIFFFGSGASASVAIDAEHKFFRLGTPTTALVDTLMQRMATGIAEPHHVFCLLSYTGRTIPLIEVAEQAKAAGAQILAITAPHSPLADLADVAIDVPSVENTDVYAPMTSRLMHLLVIDLLFTHVALRLGPLTQQRVQKTKEALNDTRVKE